MSVDLNVVDVQMYNKLAEWAKTKYMEPTDVIDMFVKNELEECRNTSNRKEFKIGKTESHHVRQSRLGP